MEGNHATNFDAWQLRMREVTSPQSFIDFGFYYMIAAALQRRVWTNADHQKLYPNIYPILVADPGVGKGLVIKPVIELLKEHKLENQLKKDITQMSSEQLAQAAVEAADFAEVAGNVKKPEKPKDKLKIPVGANCTTYEALVHTMANSVRRINFKRWDAKIGQTVQDIYSHNSLCFALEEISDLMHKDSDKVVKFLITAYDCGDYEYLTKTQGEDYIKRCCLNFFGGTTPKFIEDSFNDGILGDGFASRAWFIYEPRNRFYKLRSPELTPEQLEAQRKISQHILSLTRLYGYVPFSPEAWAYLENWWEKEQASPGYKRPNPSEKLNSYYSRKNIHVMKLSMILHLSEDASVKEDGHTPANPISLATAKRAMSILDTIERSMHLALNFTGANPLDKLTKKILHFLKKSGPKTTEYLLMEFWSDIPGTSAQDSLRQTLEYLKATGKIALDEKTLCWFIPSEPGTQ